MPVAFRHHQAIDSGRGLPTSRLPAKLLVELKEGGLILIDDMGPSNGRIHAKSGSIGQWP